MPGKISKAIGKLLALGNNQSVVMELFQKRLEDKMKITIGRVVNGFLIRNEEDLSVTVFEDKENEDFPDRESGYYALWEIIDFFNLRGSKHDSKRLSVVFDELEKPKKSRR